MKPWRRDVCHQVVPSWAGIRPLDGSGDGCYAERDLPACISARASGLLRHRQTVKELKRAGCYLGLVSGTQQSTLHSRSSRTPRLGSGADTRPRSPARGGRRGATGSRSGSALPTARPATSPGTQTRRQRARRAKSRSRPRRRRLTLSVHVSTHLSTDMFWMTALKGSASVTLSGRRKQPLKMALPSERQRGRG